MQVHSKSEKLCVVSKSDEMKIDKMEGAEEKFVRTWAEDQLGPDGNCSFDYCGYGYRAVETYENRFGAPWADPCEFFSGCRRGHQTHHGSRPKSVLIGRVDF